MKTERAKAKIKTKGHSSLSWAGFFILLTGTLLTATGVVYSTYESRELLNELQQKERTRNQLQVEWGQLLLEQSSLVSQGRIEERAVNELGMEIPAFESVIVVKGD